MPIRINLKELFASDPQEINVDKINFNFNKLLELGIGEKGEIGFTGPQGSAGPIGLTGPNGTRGASWFVGTGNPNSNTFIDLLDGDFYIDTSTSTIWQYDAQTNTWSIVVDLQAVVNNFLTSAGSPFVRGFGQTSPDDNRFIVFANHGNTPSDILLDSTLGNGSNNDILFLNNFNEKIVSIANFPVNTNSEFNALEKIYTDVTSSIPGRYHLELGILYSDGVDNLLTSLNENLKVRYSREDLGSPVYALTNTHINVARFSLSVPELVSLAQLNFNALYEFICPKYNNELPGPTTKQNFTVRIGAKEATGEYASYVQTDGIIFHLGSKAVSVGISDNYQSGITGSSLNGLSFLMLDHSDTVAGIFLNKKVFQNNGNIEQLAYTPPTQVAATTTTVTPVLSQYGRMGMAAFGNRIFTVSHPGNNVTNLVTDYGFLNLYNIENAKSPKLIVSSKNVGKTYDGGGFGTNCQLGGGYFSGSGVSDVKVLDNYAYIVNNVSANSAADQLIGGSFGSGYYKLGFQIIQYNFNQNQFARISQIYNSSYPEEMEAVSKLAIYNNYAITVSKNYETSVANTGVTYNSGRFNVINISDKDNPFLLHTRAQARTNYLALEVIDDYAITLTFEQGLPDGGYPTSTISYVRVYVDVYDLTLLNPDPFNLNEGTYPQIVEHLYSTRSVPASMFVNNGTTGVGQYGSDFSIEKQIGAITGNKDNVLVGYGNTIKRFNLVSSSVCYTISGGRPNFFNLTQSSQFTVGSDINAFIVDMKLSETNLYVLTKNFSSSNVTLFRYDLSDPTNPILIYSKVLSDNTAARFLKIGRMIYLCVENGDGGTGLIAIESDGIITPSAEIADLRSNSIHVTKEVTVGSTLKVHNNIRVGKGGVYSKRINTNQIYGEVSLIDGTSLRLTRNSSLNLAGSADPRYDLVEVLGSNFYQINVSSNSGSFINAGLNDVFALNVAPVNYDRHIMWYCGGSPFFYPTDQQCFAQMEYGFGFSAVSYTVYKRKALYQNYDGDSIIVPAFKRLIVAFRMSGAMQILTGATCAFLFRAHKFGLGNLTPNTYTPSTPSGGGRL